MGNSASRRPVSLWQIHLCRIHCRVWFAETWMCSDEETHKTKTFWHPGVFQHLMSSVVSCLFFEKTKILMFRAVLAAIEKFFVIFLPRVCGEKAAEFLKDYPTEESVFRRTWQGRSGCRLCCRHLPTVQLRA